MGRNQRIKNALKAVGVSQDKLAARLNITQAAVGKQLNKEEDIDSIEFIDAVAELTGYPREALISGDGYKIPDEGAGVGIANEPPMQGIPASMKDIEQTVVGGDTEYILIHRSVLRDSKLISSEQLSAALDQMAKDKRLMEIVINENVKLTERLMALEPKPPTSQKAKH